MKLNKKKPNPKKISKESIDQLIAAINTEIKGEFIPRSKINQQSPSFPYNHRTLANRDSLHTGVKGAFMVGKHIIYPKIALIEMLREDLSK
jgi:hypothetical protein